MNVNIGLVRYSAVVCWRRERGIRQRRRLIRSRNLPCSPASTGCSMMSRLKSARTKHCGTASGERSAPSDLASLKKPYSVMRLAVTPALALIASRASLISLVSACGSPILSHPMIGRQGSHIVRSVARTSTKVLPAFSVQHDASLECDALCRECGYCKNNAHCYASHRTVLPQIGRAWGG